MDPGDLQRLPGEVDAVVVDAIAVGDRAAVEAGVWASTACRPKSLSWVYCSALIAIRRS
jgi:hypothetical protein